MLELRRAISRGAEAARDFPDTLRFIGIAGESRFKLQLLLDALDTGRDLRGDGEIRVQVGAADAALDAHGFRTRRDDAVARGAIVDGPHGLGRRKGGGAETLVGIDIGRKEIRIVVRILQQAGEVMPHKGGHAVLGGGIVEYRCAILCLQRLVNMAG